MLSDAISARGLRGRGILTAAAGHRVRVALYATCPLRQPGSQSDRTHPQERDVGATRGSWTYSTT